MSNNRESVKNKIHYRTYVEDDAGIKKHDVKEQILPWENVHN